MIKIGLVTGELPPMEGGVGAFTQELGKELAALGHEIFVISSRDSRPKNLTRKARQLNEPIDIGWGKLLARGRKWGRKDYHMIADMAVRYELDVVNIQYQAAAYNMRSPFINLLPWRLRGIAKSVVTFHDLRVPYLFPKAGSLRDKTVRFMANRADGVITTNLADTQQLATCNLQHLQQIPIGSNINVHSVSEYERQTVRQELGLSPDDKLIGYFGFLNPSKGADTLIDALMQLPNNHHVVFIGGQTGASDPQNNSEFLNNLHLQLATYNLQSRVHWTGFVDDAVVSAHFAACDVVALPYKDGVSLRRGTLMAALAHGCAVVTTHASTGDEAIFRDGENCVLVAVDDVEELENGILRVVEDDALRVKIGRNAHNLSQQFTWDKIAMQTVAFYEQVLRA